MKILIISDLHLGSPLFNKKSEFISLIKSPTYGIIILNGDIFDVWEEDADKIAKHNQRAIAAINEVSQEKPVYFVRGNHDPDDEDIKKITPHVIIVSQYSIGDLFVIHGDEFDPLVTKYSWLAKLLFIPHWIGERLGLNIKAFFRELTNSISNKRDEDYYKDLVNDVNNEAIKKYKDRCKILVLGHTHSPEIVKTPECVYINGGDFIHNYTYVEFDTDDNSHSLKGI